MFIVVLVSLALLSVLFLSRRFTNDHSNEPPSAAGAWPIIGHLSLFTGSQLPHLTLGAMAEKYGPLFTIRLGLQRTLVINTWKMAKECFTVNDVAVSSRPIVISTQQLSYNQAMFAFTPSGPFWRDMRKIAASELLSNRRIELLSNVRVSEIETSVKQLFKLWDEKKDESGRVVAELTQWFGELTLNAVLRMVVGKRCFGAINEEEAQRCLKAFREFFRLTGVFLVGDAVPFLRWLDVGGHEKAMKETAKELDKIFSEWLEEHRNVRSSAESRRNQDFMDVMLSVLDGTDQIAGFDADTVTKATTLILIGGAVDTIRTTLTWAISCLLNNSHALQEAQKELDIKVGKERPLKESDISNLVYIQAIVKETLRLHPPTPITGPREFTEDCIVDGYHIPRGTRLITNLWKIHTDPSIWSDPLEFKPERFLTTHRDVDVRGQQHFEFLPFGGGRRMCPGVSFGLQMVHVALCNLLHSFEISKPSDEPIDMTEMSGLIVTKATPLDVLIKPRFSSKLYD